MGLSQKSGITPSIAIIAITNHGKTMEPLLNPIINIAPPITGPTVRPIAAVLVATSFKVPRIPGLVTEFVKRIVLHGQAKTVSKVLKIMMAKRAASRAVAEGIRAANEIKVYRKKRQQRKL